LHKIPGTASSLCGMAGLDNMFKVERKCTPGNNVSWYEVMLSPFKTFDEATEYIEKHRQYYSLEHQNYKITHQNKIILN
jgi:hypothetical protein